MQKAKTRTETPTLPDFTEAVSPPLFQFPVAQEFQGQKFPKGTTVKLSTGGKIVPLKQFSSKNSPGIQALLRAVMELEDRRLENSSQEIKKAPGKGILPLTGLAAGLSILFSPEVAQAATHLASTTTSDNFWANFLTALGMATGGILSTFSGKNPKKDYPALIHDLLHGKAQNGRGRERQ